jgi:glycerol kinase
VAFSVADLGRAMEADMGGCIARLRVDGGASENALLMQFQADVLDVTIDRPANVETTALGAAYLAGLAVGAFDGLDAVRRAHRVARTFSPAMSETERSAHLRRWAEGIRRARSSG